MQIPPGDIRESRRILQQSLSLIVYNKVRWGVRCAGVQSFRTRTLFSDSNRGIVYHIRSTVLRGALKKSYIAQLLNIQCYRKPERNFKVFYRF